MSWMTLMGLAVGLAMDALAVAIAAGIALGQVTGRQAFRLAFHFGLFQAMMPVFGWLAGREIAPAVARFDHWVAFALLTYIGAKMLVDSQQPDAHREFRDPTRGLSLVTLSLATSIDALGVGMTMGVLGEDIWKASATIGLVAGLFTAAGICFGNRLGQRWRRRAELIGGCVLIWIGTRIVVHHILSGT